MLKSPVMINSWGAVAAEERKELKSSRKTETVDSSTNYESRQNIYIPLLVRRE